MNRSNLIVAVMVALGAGLVGCGQEMDGVSQEVDGVSQQVDSLKASKPAPAPTYALKTTDVRSSSPVWKTSFPAYSTPAVHIALNVTGTLSGHHSQRVLIYAPGGNAFSDVTVYFATNVAAASGEQQAERTSTGWRVWVSLPVAGTQITEYSLLGQWSVAAYVDGMTAVPAVTFSLTAN